MRIINERCCYQLDTRDAAVCIGYPNGTINLHLPDAFHLQTVTKLRKLFRLALEWRWRNEEAVRILEESIDDYGRATKQFYDAAKEIQRDGYEKPDIEGLDPAIKKARKERNVERDRDVKLAKRVYEKAVKIEKIWNEEKAKYQ